MHLTDEETAKKCLENPELFSVLYERHFIKLRSFLFGRFNLSEDEIEDILQEAFIKAFLNLKTFKTEKKFKTWLYTIALNTGYSFVRNPRSEDILNYENILHAEVDKHDERKEETYTAKKAILSLKDQHRDILTQHYIQGKSISEIAGKKGMRNYTVKMLLGRATKELKLKILEGDL